MELKGETVMLIVSHWLSNRKEESVIMDAAGGAIILWNLDANPDINRIALHLTNETDIKFSASKD